MRSRTPLIGARLGARLRREWRTKLWLGAVLGAVFCGGYFAIQRTPVQAADTLELTWLDRAVTFSPRWAWVYQSVYLLFPTAWLARTRHDLRRYAAGFLLITAIGFAFFLLWPIAAPRPVDAPRTGMYGLLVSYDGLINTFPSLHVALATYAACFAASVLGGRARRAAAVVLTTWVTLIAYATLATKQHYFVDVPAGVLLGWLGHVAATRLQEPMPGTRLGRHAHATEGGAA